MLYLLFWFSVSLFFLAVALVMTIFLISTTITSLIVRVPWVPTGAKIGRKMFELAELKPGEGVVDFGCGDGSLLITAVKDFGAASGIGFEMDLLLRWRGRILARLNKVASKISLRGGNFFKLKEFPPAEVVACYLFPEIQVKLEPLLKERYPSGTRVVCRAFKYPTLPLVKTAEFKGETLYLYQIP
jgi:ubiquinone/menaquinone biosynthesis C-methylase UbiE